jgi:tetratricopeptide (TPR) repeat protein
LFWGAGLFAVAALGASAWLLRTRQPGWTVGVLWFLGVTLPTAGIIAVGAQLTADRYTYFPQLGLLTAIACVLPAVPERFRRAAWLAGAATVFACAALLWGQIVVWSNSELLFEHALHRDPDNARALQALGMIRLQQNRVDEATELLTQAANFNPTDGFPLSNLARAHLAQGQSERAFEEAARATHLPVEPLNRGLVLQFYGKLLAQAHRDAEAEPVLRAAVEAKPDLPVELDLARVLISLQRDDEARAAFQQCVARFAKDPRCYLEQAQLDVQQGRQAEVPALLDAVDRLAPGNPKVSQLREQSRPDGG